MDVGLNVDFDGKKNIVMMGDIINVYPVGGMVCEYARLRPTEIKPLIMENPYFHDTEELKGPIALMNGDKDTSQVKSFILEKTGFDEFGIGTIGQTLLSAYAAYADSYVAFKHSFNMLVSGEEYEEDQVMAFWGLYATNTDFQHIDFHIMFFDDSFHSIYTIKSSISLILFEAAHVMDANTKFVKCKNCGNYFVPVGRSDSVYCGYPAPQDETKACRDVGANVTRVKKMKNDILTKEYRRLYMRLKMAVKRHPDDIALRERLTELTEGMKVRKKQKEDGTVSADGILEWLTSFDNHLNGD